MKITLCAMALLTLIAAAGARAQTLDAAPISPYSIAPALDKFANSATIPALTSPDSAAIGGGLQLDRTRGDDPAWARFASDTGNLLFLSAGTLLPLATDGKDGAQRSIRVADALVTSTLLAEGLKTAIHKKRPDGTDYKSFPSGHATAAFTVAAMQASYHPKQAIFWYAGATTIAASRVTLRRHDTFDVLAGAALGYATARLELGQKRGLLLRPFIRQTAPDNRVTGLSFSKSF